MKQKNFNTLKGSLDTHDVSELTAIIGHRCSQKTKDRIKSILTYDSSRIPSYGILERLMFEEFHWSYCVGQSYVDEIRTIRNIILRGK